MSDEFYIGYRKQAPPRTARFVAGTAVAIVSLVAAVAVAIGAGQRAAGDGRYAFSTVESFEGWLVPDPVPHLAIEGDNGPQGALMVAQGKHGVPDYVRNAMGNRVRLDATRIERHGILMLELAGEDRFEIVDNIRARDWSPLASQTVVLTGELVDTKCYLGVMKPGWGKVHRGCAVECLRGGIQPGLLVRSDDGSARVVLIAVDPGVINPEWAARRIEISGPVHGRGAFQVISAEKVRLLP